MCNETMPNNRQPFWVPATGETSLSGQPAAKIIFAQHDDPELRESDSVVPFYYVACLRQTGFKASL